MNTLYNKKDNTLKEIYEKLQTLLTESKKDFAEITLIKNTDFGGVGTSQLKLYNAELTSYAQYDTALKLVFIPKGKRTAYKTYLYGSNDFAIFKGFCNTERAEDNCFTCFDKNRLYDFIDKTKGEKLAEYSERVFAEDIDKMEKLYKVITTSSVETFNTIEELLKKYEKVGETKNNVVRRELQGTPILKGLGGAMFDGYCQNKAVIRYEDYKTAELMSN